MSPLIKMKENELFIMSQVRYALSWILCGVSILKSTACGQTSRPIIGTEIQTHRNIKACSRGYNLLLVY